MKDKHTQVDQSGEEKGSKFKRNPRNQDDPENKIRMTEFHKRIAKQKRKVTDKKKIRDIERLLEKEGLPEEIRQKKLSDLKELKKEIKNKKEAENFQLKYKKIKFIEKRKVIRKME